ncbi:MAG: hypothetical protein J6A01_02645 [Proteobacteria bacterium]|nr:hypothetical protein [Pseudomonadota bacterium]
MKKSAHHSKHHSGKKHLSDNSDHDPKKRFKLLWIILIYILLAVVSCIIGYFLFTPSPQAQIDGSKPGKTLENDKNKPDGTVKTEIRRLLGEDVNIQSLYLNGMKFKFYCTPKDGKVRFRYGGYADDFLDSSDTELEAIVRDYKGLPKGDHIVIGGGQISAIFHIGHAQRGHTISFNGVSIYIVGDEEDPDMVKKTANTDFIYLPCVRDKQY